MVRDPTGAILLTSHRANPEDFPAFPQPGFHQGMATAIIRSRPWRGTVILTIAEPLSHRQEVGVEMAVALALPLPGDGAAECGGRSFTGWASGLRPLEALRNQLSRRGATALSAVPVAGLPSELRPIAETVNDLLRGWTRPLVPNAALPANAAHELRTPTGRGAGAGAALAPAINRHRHPAAAPMRWNRRSSASAGCPNG